MVEQASACRPGWQAEACATTVLKVEQIRRKTEQSNFGAQFGAFQCGKFVCQS
jgi:hypothetical protein